MCCSQAKLALPLGGVPYAQRGSSARDSLHQSLILNGGFAMMKSIFLSMCCGWVKLSALCLPKS